jgi:hypothetical protein
LSSFKKPILFSAHFGIEPEKLEFANLIDPFLNVDTQLFIDPILLEKSSNSIISKYAYTQFRTHFGNLVRLLKLSKSEDDVAWRAAERLLDLKEPPATGLGYGGKSRSGSSRPEEIRTQILQTAKEIIELGSEDPEMIALMGFFEEGVGPDTISDFTTRVIIPQLAEITEDFCAKNNIPCDRFEQFEEKSLPYIQMNNRRSALLLVPRDIVRDLPVAKDWSEVERAIEKNNRIRQQVNAFLGTIAKPTVADKKAALRRYAFSSANAFELFLATVKEHTSCYDPNLDILGYFKFKELIAQGQVQVELKKSYDLSAGPEKVREVVLDAIEFYKQQVENRDLWKELWNGDKPKKERASQLFFAAIAEAFCVAHNIDISPEPNMGGGPVDFKFSDGYQARVVVEMKRSSGTVVHGYETQLEIYKKAASTEFGIFVIMDYGDLGEKFQKINNIRNRRIAQGQRASDIIVIDASKKESASKRKDTSGQDDLFGDGAN